MGRLVLCIFLACFGTQKLNGLFSETVLDFQSIFNGYWGNEGQIQQVGQGLDEVKFCIKPVDVPAFRPNAALTIKEYINGVVHFFNLAEILDGVEENTVILKLYTIPGVSPDEAKTYDLKKLKTIRLEDLQSTDDCFAIFDVGYRKYVTGNYPDCKHTVNGKPPRVGLNYTCDVSIATFPKDTDQASPMLPHVMRLKLPRYPLINPPQDYVSPCDDWGTTTQ